MEIPVELQEPYKTVIKVANVLNDYGRTNPEVDVLKIGIRLADKFEENTPGFDRKKFLNTVEKFGYENAVQRGLTQ